MFAFSTYTLYIFNLSKTKVQRKKCSTEQSTEQNSLIHLDLGEKIYGQNKVNSYKSVRFAIMWWISKNKEAY